MHTQPTRLLGHVLRPMPGIPGVWASEVHPVTYTQVTLLERPHYDETRWLAELFVGPTLVARVIGATVGDVEAAIEAELRRRWLGEARGAAA